ncbi:hypothetical protein H6P81_002260 [Aristolochia fimbriata]|uniref:Uncharacterized protein n=1 Tax=Aristolochia fimbriata TaxID=158543 RepID=A0AAV7FCH9_ARIFI|nr:hypothetical protein H6P81_002260 [Aristolochia fimbriata]
MSSRAETFGSRCNAQWDWGWGEGGEREREERGEEKRTDRYMDVAFHGFGGISSLLGALQWLRLHLFVNVISGSDLVNGVIKETETSPGSGLRFLVQCRGRCIRPDAVAVSGDYGRTFASDTES